MDFFISFTNFYNQLFNHPSYNLFEINRYFATNFLSHIINSTIRHQHSFILYWTHERYMQTAPCSSHILSLYHSSRIISPVWMGELFTSRNETTYGHSTNVPNAPEFHPQLLLPATMIFPTLGHSDRVSPAIKFVQWRTPSRLHTPDNTSNCTLWRALLRPPCRRHRLAVSLTIQAKERALLFFELKIQIVSLYLSWS